MFWNSFVFILGLFKIWFMKKIKLNHSKNLHEWNQTIKFRTIIIDLIYCFETIIIDLVYCFKPYRIVRSYFFPNQTVKLFFKNKMVPKDRLSELANKEINNQWQIKILSFKSTLSDLISPNSFCYINPKSCEQVKVEISSIYREKKSFLILFFVLVFDLWIYVGRNYNLFSDSII